MHALAAYVVRIYDHRLAGKKEDRFHKLGHVGGYDFLNLVHAYFSSLGTELKVIVEQKRNRVLRVIDLEKDPTKRHIDGIIEYGDFGMKSNIVNVKSGKQVYEKKSLDSDLKRYYFRFELPKDAICGVVLLHEINASGVKTVISTGLTQFTSKQLGDAKLRIEGLTVERALSEWMKSAQVKQIKLSRYHGKGMVTDIADSIGKTNAEVIFKPSERNGSFGLMSDFFPSKHRKQTEQAKLLSAVGSNCSAVRVVASLEGRRRTFSMHSADFAASVELDEDTVSIVEGVPDLASLRNFATTLSSEIMATL